MTSPETSRAALADELLPCPFCGGANLHRFSHYTSCHDGVREIPKIMCADCQGEAPVKSWGIRRAPPAVEGGARLWRHKKRRTVYTEIGRGLLQTADAGSLTDNEPMVIYRDNNTGNFWVRDAIEFEDGRFEEVVETGPVTENEYAPLSQPQIEGGAVREALEAVWNDWEIANDASGAEDYEIKDVSPETVQLVKAALAPPQTGLNHRATEFSDKPIGHQKAEGDAT